MMQVVTISQVHVHIGTGVVTEGGKKLFDQLQLEVTNLGFRQGHIEDQEWTK